MIGSLTKNQILEVINWIDKQELGIDINLFFKKCKSTSTGLRHITKYEYGIILLDILKEQMKKEYETDEEIKKHLLKARELREKWRKNKDNKLVDNICNEYESYIYQINIEREN